MKLLRMLFREVEGSWWQDSHCFAVAGSRVRKVLDLLIWENRLVFVADEVSVLSFKRPSEFSRRRLPSTPSSSVSSRSAAHFPIGRSVILRFFPSPDARDSLHSMAGNRGTFAPRMATQKMWLAALLLSVSSGKPRTFYFRSLSRSSLP